MRNSFLIILFIFSNFIFSQENTKDTLAKSKYERLKVGDKVEIYMQVRGKDYGSLGAGDFDENRKFNSKTDLKLKGKIINKFITDGPNWFVKIKIEKMFLEGRKVNKMIILQEEMAIGTGNIFNLWNLEIKQSR